MRRAHRSQEPSAEDPSGALHEVSNALTVVLGWLEVARDAVPSGPARDALEIAREHAVRGHRVARRAIGAALPEVESDRAAADVLTAVATAVQPEAEAKGIRVAVAPAPGRAVVLANAAELLQILLNLALNAIAFTPSGREVRLTLEVGPRGATFAVDDDGPGIDPARVETLFEGPRSSRRGGAGIGLAHSATLAERHGGDLRLARASPGARFELFWPDGEARSRPRDRTGALAGRRVVVLDDEPEVRSLLELGLGNRGASVSGARDEAGLASLVAEGPVDVALIDLSPLGSAPEDALRRIRTLLGASPMVLISGSGGPEALPAGFAAWIRKPFAVAEVAEVLADVLP